MEGLSLKIFEVGVFNREKAGDIQTHMEKITV